MVHPTARFDHHLFVQLEQLPTRFDLPDQHKTQPASDFIERLLQAEWPVDRLTRYEGFAETLAVGVPVYRFWVRGERPNQDTSLFVDTPVS
jgi:hypothetical protein